jgi:hypothetical protein
MDSFKIEKLNDHNYHTWNFKVMSYLISKNLDQIILQNAVANDEWRNNDKQARAIISLSVSDDLIPIIQRCETAKQMWEGLAARFHMRNNSNVCFLRRKLLNLEKLSTESMIINLNLKKLKLIKIMNLQLL